MNNERAPSAEDLGLDPEANSCAEPDWLGHRLPSAPIGLGPIDSPSRACGWGHPHCPLRIATPASRFGLSVALGAGSSGDVDAAAKQQWRKYTCDRCGGRVLNGPTEWQARPPNGAATERRAVQWAWGQMHRGTPESLQDVPGADRASARVRIMRYVHWSPLVCVHSGVKVRC